MELTLNKEKFDTFFTIARALNEHQIVPTLFGSLGLYRLIGEFGIAHDVDILVPDDLLLRDFPIFVEIMKKLHFELQHEREREFVRGDEVVAFAPENDLYTLTAIKPGSLMITVLSGVRFKELTPEQYLLCYQTLLRDAYRQEKRNGADQEKIDRINQYLATKR